MFGETTISYVKIWFIIQLKQPIINGWPSGPRENKNTNSIKSPCRTFELIFSFKCFAKQNIGVWIFNFGFSISALRIDPFEHFFGRTSKAQNGKLILGLSCNIFPLFFLPPKKKQQEQVMFFKIRKPPNFSQN